MKFTGLLLVCLFALTTAKPAQELELILRTLLKELENEHAQRDIGAVNFGGTHVGEDFIEVKIIREMDEVKADGKTHKPKYSIVYGQGQADKTSVVHASESKTWAQLDMCENGAEGCYMIRDLTPNTEYWVQLEVQMWVNGAYQYIDSKKDVEQIRTKAREQNVP